MKLKQVILNFETKDAEGNKRLEPLEFIVYSEDDKYCLMVVKILYMEMLKSIVDESVLVKALYLFKKVKQNNKILYVQVGENEENGKAKERLYTQARNSKHTGLNF